MLVKVKSIATSGLDPIEIDVEINVSSRGLPIFDLVGLPNKAVAESRQRVRTAIVNSNLEFPKQRIIVNLAPADVPKEGSCYDLPIAIGILSVEMGFKVPEDSMFFGELSLDGTLRHTKGVLLLALFAKEKKIKNIYVPYLSANEAAVVEGVCVYPVKSLAELIAYCTNQITVSPVKYRDADFKEKRAEADFDMAEIVGQEQAKRAIEIAASGGHNFFMIGSPGAGKTMLARALAGILPDLTQEESLEVTKIYSISGRIQPGQSLIKARPFRAPHHTISQVGLIGGGTYPQPGEISLAHRGVLFLDEFNEFPRSVTEALRQPMEDGKLTISRSRARIKYPARFILVASSNPCPCGYAYDPKRMCKCSLKEIKRYRKRISGPLLDRIDLHLEIPVVELEKLSQDLEGEVKRESSAQVRLRILDVRKLQSHRFCKDGIWTNSEMKNSQIKKYCRLSFSVKSLLMQAAAKFHLSARAYYKIIKVARTIADLDCSTNIEVKHLAEALQYRVRVD